MNVGASLYNAVSYWERKRLIYNALLATLVLVCWGPDILGGGPRAWLGGGLVLFVLAVIANILYCCVYPVDLVVQCTPLRTWLNRARWLLLTAGTVIAGALALWVMLRDGMA